MTIALYGRCSTRDQSTRHQIDSLRAYASAKGVEAIEFIDEGQSGVKDSRPALNELLRAARRGEIDTVVCTKLDRLARSTRHLCALSEEFEALGVALVILDQAIDTKTPTGKLLFGVLAAIAEFERDLIVDRVRSGMAAARKSGKRIGRPPALDASARDRARHMRDEGASLRAIGKALNVSHATVRSCLAAEANV